MTHFLQLVATALIVGVVGGCGPSEPRQPDLPRQPNRWVSSITVDPDSQINYIGKTRELVFTTVNWGEALNGRRTISVGDVVNGVQIGAIRCSFYWKDASYGGAQYMWRGRWGCMAGRNRYEVENAVNEDGSKQFDYIHISPVSLKANWR